MIDSTRDELAAGLQDAVADAGYEWHVTASSITIEEYGDDQRGELSTSIPFQIAADEGEKPQSVSEAIAAAHETVGLPDTVESVSVVSGHVNYHLDTGKLVRETLSRIASRGDSYGSQRLQDPDTILADVSSPNIAKPLHVGHLRNTILSDAVMNILEERGHDVTRDNHIGDWGVQFGNLMYEFVERGDREALEADPIGHLLELYQQFEQRDNELEEAGEDEQRQYHQEQGKEWFTRLEEGEQEAVELWEVFREKSIQRFKETYDELGVEFDIWIGESFYAQEGWNDRIIEKALENDVAIRGEDQAVFIPIYPDDLEGVEDPETASVDRSLSRAHEAMDLLGPDEEITDIEEFDAFYIVKSDGSTVYGTRDLATIEYRIEEFDIDQSVYVVATEQDLYFQQLFAAARKMGYDDIKLKHISYGMISLPEGSMSTRGGTIITAREVLDQAKKAALAMVKEKGRNVDDAEAVAEKIALATIKYEMVASNRHKDVTFDIDKAVSLEGDTGPYVQYASTRAYSILDAAEREASVTDLDPTVLNETDVELIYELAQYPLVLEICVERYDAAPLARYLLGLAHIFNSFYHKNRVLDAEDAADERLALTDVTRQVFENGLSLLGIETLEAM